MKMKMKMKMKKLTLTAVILSAFFSTTNVVAKETIAYLGPAGAWSIW